MGRDEILHDIDTHVRENGPGVYTGPELADATWYQTQQITAALAQRDDAEYEMKHDVSKNDGNGWIFE